MELKSSITTIFLLCLLLAAPYFSRGGSDASDLDSETYEIDYRGPETHSYIPPPNRSGGRPSIHRESVMTHRKSKVFRAGNVGGNYFSWHANASPTSFSMDEMQPRRT